MVGISHTTLGEAGTVPNAFSNSESQKLVRTLAWAHGFDELASDLRQMDATEYEQCRYRGIQESAGTLTLKAIEAGLLRGIAGLAEPDEYESFNLDHPNEYFSKIVGEWRSWAKRGRFGERIGRIWVPVPGLLAEVSPDVFGELRFEGRDDDWQVWHCTPPKEKGHAFLRMARVCDGMHQQCKRSSLRVCREFFGFPKKCCSTSAGVKCQSLGRTLAMYAFESVVATILEREGFWVRASFKVALSREDKHAIGRPSSPRWGIDVIAYRPGDKLLWIVECKSYLDSRGVTRHGFTPAQPRLKLFNDATLREVVFYRVVG